MWRSSGSGGRNDDCSGTHRREGGLREREREMVEETDKYLPAEWEEVWKRVAAKNVDMVTGRRVREG
jgi:hypothetical protein